MDKINEQVHNALKTHPSIRILGALPTKCLDSEDYLTSVSSMIEPFVTVWKETALTHLVAVEVWPRTSHFALDLNNHKYNFDTAHEEKIVLPVFLLQYFRKRKLWHLQRFPRQDIPLADRIAVLHHANGEDATPFLQDHTKIITHYAPRSITRQSQAPVPPEEQETWLAERVKLWERRGEEKDRKWRSMSRRILST